ncbi:MAG: CHAT domain-containing tetratricopeptide repeat protein, partial [Pyrinomonadaceae bacterium]
LEYYAQTLAIRQAAADHRGEAEALNNIAEVYDAMGEKKKALENFELALQLWRAAADRSGESSTLSNMAALYSSIGQPRKALDLFNEALPLRRASGDRPGEAATLNDIGVTYFALAELQKALSYFDQALSIVKAIGDRRGAAYTMTSMGLLYDALDEKQKALDYYEQSLALLKALDDRYGTAAALNNEALLYLSLHENQKALDYYNQSLSLVVALGDRYGQATVLNGLGKVYLLMGEPQKALDSFNQSLPIRRAISDRSGEAYTLHNIGGVYERLGEKQKALEHYDQALALWSVVGDRRGEASTLISTGRVYDALGDAPKALDFLNRGLALHRTVSNRSGQAQSLYEIARLERDRGNLIEARSRIEAALGIIESLRTKIASEQLRSSYFSSVQEYYELYIDVLMRLHKLHPSEGNDAAALQGSERARGRGLIDLLIESHADIRQGVDPQLLERERDLQQLLNAKAERQLRLLSGKHSEESAQAVARELQSLTTEYQEIEAQIRSKSPRYAALTQPQPLALRDIQAELLDQDTLLLEYSLGEQQSYLWAVTQTGIASYGLPSRTVIDELAKNFYNLLTASSHPAEPGKKRGLGVETSRGSYGDVANRLSQMVLGPVAAQLGKKRLVIVADGALQYVPFGALFSPTMTNRRKTNTPLIVDHEIISLPSATTLAVLRRELPERQTAVKYVVVLADPVFDVRDERIKKGPRDTADTANKQETTAENRGLGLAIEKSAEDTGLSAGLLTIPRLRGTRREAEAILALVPANESKQALDFDASRATAFSPELSQYRYVHFATHGLLNSVHPDLSGIVLSMIDKNGAPEDGFLRGHEIFNLRLSAELVVLSACQTGLGKEVRGEGLVGLTRAFMYAGAPRVVVSLWSVSDLATAELMERFYKGMLVDKLRPAAALRAAQVAMWKQQHWSSPFYWAAFTLEGEWR